MSELFYEVGISNNPLAIGAVFTALFFGILGLLFLAYLAWKKFRPIWLDVGNLPVSENGHMGLNFRLDGLDAIAADKARKAIGKIGELITSLVLVQRGWTQLPSQPNGVHKADGIFIKQSRRGKSFRVLFVETKTSASSDIPVNRFEGDRMTHFELVADLESYIASQLPSMPTEIAERLIKALRDRSVYVEKQFYAHSLPLAESYVFKVSLNGELKPVSPIEKIGGESHQRLFQSLAIGIQRLIPNSIGIEERGVAMEVGEDVVDRGVF